MTTAALPQLPVVSSGSKQQLEDSNSQQLDTKQFNTQESQVRSNEICLSTIILIIIFKKRNWAYLFQQSLMNDYLMSFRQVNLFLGHPATFHSVQLESFL